MEQLGLSVLLLAYLAVADEAASLSTSEAVATVDSGPGVTPRVTRAFVQVMHVSRTPAPTLVFTCAKRGGSLLTTALSGAGLAAVVVHRDDAWMAALQAAANATVAVLLDTSCDHTPRFLARVDAMNMFGPRRHWVLFNLDGAGGGTVLEHGAYRLEADVPLDPASLQSCYAHVIRLLDPLGVYVDSDVSAICTAGASAGTVVAVSAHRVHPGAPLRLSLAAHWEGGVLRHADTRPVVARRLDLHGYVLNTGFMVFNKEELKVNVAEGRLTSDYFASFAWDMMHDLANMLNATINVTLTNSYGYPKPGSMPTSGLLGLQLRNEVEIVGTGYSMIQDPTRLQIAEFTNFFCPGRGVFVFRAPPISYENNVFTLPFPLTLWEASAGLVAVCGLLLLVVLRAEKTVDSQDDAANDDDHNDDHTLHSSSDAVLLAVAAICQQGSPVETRGVSARIVALTLFVLVLVLHTCYSASIVVLLQGTSTGMRHYRDLLSSQIKVGSANVSFIVHYMRTETDPVRQAVYWEKIMERGKKANLLSNEAGVRRAQREYFAFYGVEGSIYEEIGRTWHEHEKCGLRAIGHDFLRVKDPHICITKSSHNSEAFRIMLRRLGERGIWHRMKGKYLRAKPACTNHAAVFNSVSLTDCRGAFYVLLAVMAASVVVLVAELAVHWAKRRPAREGPLRQ